MSDFIYKKKITASLGWLRPLTEVLDNDGKVLRPKGDAAPVMRIGGEVIEGSEETSEYGNFVRWRGKFLAQVVDRDGSLVTYGSMNLILPSVGSDFIASMMQPEMRKLGERKSHDRRTGLFYVPSGTLPEAANDFLAVRFTGDLWIQPPADGKVSQTGYEFEWRTVSQDQRFDTMANLIVGDKPLLPAPTPAPTPEPQENSAPQSGEVGTHKGGKRQAA